MTSKRNEKIITVLAIAILAYAGISYHFTGDLFSPPGDLFDKATHPTYTLSFETMGVCATPVCANKRLYIGNVNVRKKYSPYAVNTLGLINCIHHWKGNVRASVEKPDGSVSQLVDKRIDLCVGWPTQSKPVTFSEPFTSIQSGNYKINIKMVKNGRITTQKTKKVYLTE